MKDGIRPDPNVVHPIAGYESEIYIKPTVSSDLDAVRAELKRMLV